MLPTFHNLSLKQLLSDKKPHFLSKCRTIFLSPPLVLLFGNLSQHLRPSSDLSTFSFLYSFYHFSFHFYSNRFKYLHVLDCRIKFTLTPFTPTQKSHLGFQILYYFCVKRQCHTSVSVSP